MRTFEEPDTPVVLGLLQTAFGEWPREMAGVGRYEFFRWKHLESPFGPSSMYVAEADGRIVGFEARMPWLFQAAGTVLLASRGADLAVHPSYRGRGISLALRRAATFTDEVSFTWSNPNRQSLPGSLRFGRKLVGKVPRFIRLSPHPVRTLLRLARQEWPDPDEITIDAPRASAILADWAPPERLLLADGERLTTARSLDFLRWRYAAAEYRALRVAKPGRGEGIVIFRARRHARLWWLDVCELLVEPDDASLSRTLLTGMRESAAVDFVRCSFPSRFAAARQGFLQYPGGSALMTTPLRGDLEPDPTRLSSWALTGGDLELI